MHRGEAAIVLSLLRNDAKAPLHSYMHIMENMQTTVGQYVVNSCVKSGQVVLQDIPFADDTDVTIVIIPKVNLQQLSFLKARELTKSISGNLSDDIIQERQRE